MILSKAPNPSGRATMSFTGWLFSTHNSGLATSPSARRFRQSGAVNSISASTKISTSASARAKPCTKRFHVRDLPPSAKSATSTPAARARSAVASVQPLARTKIRASSPLKSCAKSRATISAMPAASLWARTPISTRIRSPSAAVLRRCSGRAAPRRRQPAGRGPTAPPRPTAPRPSAM